MKNLKIVHGILYVLIVTPIWYYLLYQILSRVGATELMWFLFWIYIPVSILTVLLIKLAES